MSLSSSVSAPRMSRVTFFPCSPATRRTIRVIFSNNLSDGNHAHFHDPLLQLVEAALEHPGRLLQAAHQFAVADAAQALGQIGDGALGKDQFADNVHQLVELVDIDPHGAADGTQRSAPLAAVAGAPLPFRRGLRNGHGGVFRGRTGTSRFGRAAGHQLFHGQVIPAQQRGNRGQLGGGAEQDLKGDPVGNVADTGERTDHLPVLLQKFGQLCQLLVEGGQAEGRLDPQQVAPFAQILLQAVFLVLGQDIENLLGDARAAGFRRLLPAGPRRLNAA